MNDEDYAAWGLKAPPARIDPPGAPRDVASLIARAAVACPDDEALADASRRYSFAQLDRAVTAIAGLMQRAGVSSGDRVAASLGNECALVIAFFAAMRLGAVWVGINRILPAADKQFILDHSGARLLITDSAARAQCEAFRTETPALQAVWFLDQTEADGGWGSALDQGPAGPLDLPAIDPFAPAAIMYTSGTTGVPKGVVHSQHNMIVVPAALFAHGLLSPEARRGSALPLTITNLMILGPIAAFLALKPFLFAPSAKIDALVDWMHAERIGQIAFVPTMVYDLLQSGRDLPAMLRLGCGGAPLPEVIRDAFRKRHDHEIMTSYGLTEAPTLVAQSGELVAPQGASGKAVPHLEVTIRDEDGTPLPAGSVGEICFGATRVGPWADVYTPPLGYWRDAEKTAALLRHGVVHSGDHGSLDADGWLTIADRSSELILRGGSNIYPAEIERVLHTHDDVADCAVVGRPDLRMGMLTVACIQPAHDEIDPARLVAELRELCLDRLSRYKVPDVWHVMAELPRNAMGKVIKPRLRDMVTEQA